MGTMTARERVRAALRHQQPDRVPMDLGGMNSSTMVVEGYERLKRHFKARVEIRQGSRGGKLEISYAGRDELTRIIELLGL